MRGATLSILGLYSFDNTVFNDFNLPPEIDRSVLIPDLLSECAELEILYPDIPTFKTILGSWSSHRISVWERMIKAANLQYNPIENYDRIEEWSDSGSGQSTGEAKNYVSGYNPNPGGLAPSLVQQDQADSHAENSGSAYHTGRTHGNIGVTSSQQMLSQELEIADKLDIYKFIIQDFKNRFCIPLY